MSWEVQIMKSRISFFNGTVFRKDLTRFAPTWIIYTAGCLLVILNITAADDPALTKYILGNRLSLMAFANFGYAPVCALLLFGDLFNARLCNALHAAPLRRETWFFTHLLSGLVFCLIPYMAVAVCVLPGLAWNWAAAPVWLLGSVLEFLFFFSLAVFCVFCTGSRFAAALFYGLLNFLSLFASWFVSVIYSPLLTGVEIGTGWANPLCPLINLIEHSDWMTWFDKISRSQHGLGYCWTYLLILTGVGIVLLGISLALYQRRRLECAGDFVAVKAIAPVFLVVYALAAAVVFQCFDSIFIGNSTVSLFFAVGLAVGWFTGLMLLRRTVRVFSGRSLLGFLVLGGTLLVSILLTWADPLGITRWVPSPGQVQKVQLAAGSTSSHPQDVEVSDQQKIEDITDIHAQAIDEHVSEEARSHTETVSLTLRYQLCDGSTAERSYELDVDTELAQRLVPYFSDPQVILQYEDWDTFLAQLYQIRIDYNDQLVITGADAVSLAQAIRQDCEDGNMVQFWQYHEDDYGKVDMALSVDIVVGDKDLDFAVYSDCEHTLQWLKDHGMYPDYLQ